MDTTTHNVKIAIEDMIYKFCTTYFEVDEKREGSSYILNEMVHFIWWWESSIPLVVWINGLYFNTDDVFTILKNDIPKNVFMKWYFASVDGYEKRDIYTYWSMESDAENYEKEKQTEIEQARENVLNASYRLDEAMGLEKWTSIKSMSE